MGTRDAAVVSRCERMVDDLRRLCAVAGVDLTVAGSLAECRQCWRSARSVVVDADMAATLADAGLPRRDRVLIVGRDPLGVDVWRDAVRLGVEHVVVLPDGETSLTDRLAEPDAPPASCALTVGCVSGHGGAGASTLAAALARQVAEHGHRAAVVDLDPSGGGLDLLLGVEGAPGLRWPDVTGARGVVDGDALAERLPTVSGFELLSWDRREPPMVPAEAIDAVLAALRRSRDVVVVDLPAGCPEPLAVAASLCDVVFLVVAAQVRAAAAGALAAAGLTRSCGDVRVVVRRCRHDRLRPTETAAALGLPLAGVLDDVPSLAAAADDGELVRALARSPLVGTAARLLDGLPVTALPAAG